MNSNNKSLMHYGVLGMRWGVRRSEAQLRKARQLKRQGQKEKGEALEARAKRNLKKHNLYSGQGTIEYTKRESLGKTIAKTILLGTYGTLRYNEARARGDTRFQAAVDGGAAYLSNYLSYGAASVIEPRLRREEG